MKVHVRYSISQHEYQKLIERITFYDTMRNNLLTFSFTAVLAILGIAMTARFNIVTCWICLIPFLLIIPFAARIAYYRLATAHVSSFLRKFASNRMKFEISAQTVTEGVCKHYRIIAWCVNHEMFCLGSATIAIFYFKYFPLIDLQNYLHLLSLVVPLILLRLVYIISNDVRDFSKVIEAFKEKWDEYAAKNKLST